MYLECVRFRGGGGRSAPTLYSAAWALRALRMVNSD